ncbi:MAG: hypothetical protein IJ326_04685 [Lachnospiraceae bacterium]|nr:hypothetical protein [Lachnospiraceae bacterium]
MMDFGKIMKIKSAWETFNGNHTKFMPFMKAVAQDGVQEGTIIEIKVTNSAGKEYNTNMKITQSDLELFAQMKGMMN